MRFKSDRQRRAVMAKYSYGFLPSMRNETNEDIWTGDWDRDSTPNIDDRRPFDPGVSTPVNKEVSLSDSWKNLKKVKAEYEQDIPELAEMIDTKLFRVKDEYSVIGKQLGRYLINVQDFGGLRILVETRKEARMRAQQIRDWVGDDLIKYEDKYYLTHRKDFKQAYMGYNLTVRYNGRPYEIQVNTFKMRDIADRGHEAYKHGLDQSELRKEADEAYRQGY